MARLVPSLMAAGLFVLAAAPAGAGTGIYLLSEFTFENGQTLTDLKIGYETHGTLNDARDNAVLVTHPASGNKDAYDLFIGIGKAFDPDNYFVITVDAIGGGASSAPSDGLGPKFPAYTVRDMVRAQHELLRGGFGLRRIVAVAGPQMGAFQALEWGIMYPDYMAGLIMITPSARSDRQVHALLDAMTAAVRLDPAYQGGYYDTDPVDGLVTAGMIYFPWLYTADYLQTIEDDAAFATGIRAPGAAWAEEWDANDLLYRFQAMRDYDATAPFEGDLRAALRQVEAQALIMPSTHDRILPIEMARDLFAGIPDATYVELSSRLGHLACCPDRETSSEYAFITDQIRRFLAGLE
jgi:homoserine O-acetyltransferase